MINKKNLFDFSRKSIYLMWSFFVILFLSILLLIQLEQIKSQMMFDLNDRAVDVAQRVANSVSPTVWVIFQKAENRYSTKDVASAILDAELNAEFVIGINVYGSFGHLFMGKSKTPSGRVLPFTAALNSRVNLKDVIKVRRNISQGPMTIGSVDVFYSQSIYLPRLNYLYLLESLKITFVTSLILLAFFFIRKFSLAKKSVESTLENLKMTQNQLVESEKMASLGTLIAGVAHEINTPLGVSITATSIIQENTEIIMALFNEKKITKYSLANYLEIVKKSVEMSDNSLVRVSDLILNFKQVVADQIVDDIREINLGSYMKEILITLSVALKNNKVQLQFNDEKNLFITTPPGAIAQIITNLVNNSLKHAFDNNKKRSISISIKKLINNNIEITYKDNGCGMNEEILKHIYEPFFTTKRNEGGTGLGMNIVFNLIKQKLQGTISIESKVDVGSTFIIVLPKIVNYD